MKKTIVFFENENQLKDKFLEQISFNKDLFIVDCKNAIYNDHRIYNDILNYCIDNDIDVLIFPYFQFPEYLLSSLKVIKNLKTKILITTVFSWWHNSRARANSFYELMKFEAIKLVSYQTIDPTDKRTVPQFAKKLLDYENFINTSIITKEKPVEYSYYDCRKEYGVKDNEIIILFFGTSFYGKGLDILTEAIKITKNEKLKFLISSNSKFNYIFDKKKLTNLNNVNIVSWGNFISKKDMLKLFSISDLVVLPYRKNYEFGASSVFLHAINAGKILIAPNFYPFNDVIYKYKLGYLFECENYMSIAKIFDSITIEEIRDNTKNALNEKYIEEMKKNSMGNRILQYG